ncbi:MAG: folate family ECF transporter S component [Clostridia bacterium]|nr:folate family ECF transporter S component [Clostridia bacterium]
MKKGILTLKLTVALSMLSAISIIAGKYLAISGGEVLRFSLENLPIIFAGVAFGPLAGALVGAVADLVGCLLVGYAINPIVTLGAVVIGTLAGGVWRICKKSSLSLWLCCALSVGISHLVGSVIIKTFGLSVYYDMSFEVLLLWRLLNYVIIGCLDGAILFGLMRSKLIREEISSIVGTRGERR